MKCPHCSTGLYTKNFLRQWAFQEPGNPGTVRQLVVDYCPVCKKAVVLLRKGRGVRNGDWSGRPSFELRSEEEETLLFPRYSMVGIDTDLPDHYKADLVEAVSILQLSPRVSAALSRRLLQTIFREEFGIKRNTLAQETDAFIQRKDVPASLAKQVDAIRNVGNFAAHPVKDANTGEIVEVEPGEADWLLEVLKELLDFAFIKPKQIAERTRKLNEKLRAAGKPPIRE